MSMQYRFICNMWPQMKVAGPIRDGRQEILAFRDGCLDTDEEGAAVIRGLPEYGRRILDGDITAPAHGAVPSFAEIEKDRYESMKAMEAGYCPDCDKVFSNMATFHRHRAQVHKEA